MTTSLQKRIVSAAVMLLLMGLTVKLFGARGLLALGLIICSVGVYEFVQLTIVPLNQAPWLIWFYNLIATLVLVAAGVSDPAHWVYLFLALIPVTLSLALWSRRDFADPFSLQPFAGQMTLGLLYTGVLPGMTLHLLLTPLGTKWFALLLSVVFAGDICAYMGGSIFGGPKLMPTVSPNKTISGSISGLVGSVVIGIIFAKVFKMSTSLFVSIGLSLTIGAVAQSGDLFESLLKRNRNVKDSGHFLPGHGGVLDRLDGVYFAAPIILCAAHWFS